MNDIYPVNDYGPLMPGLVMGGIAILHVFLAQFAVDLTRLYAQHAEAGRIGGVTVFVIFAVVNTSLIGFCIWLVRSSRRAFQGK